jgi:hypothetical protein
MDGRRAAAFVGLMAHQMVGTRPTMTNERLVARLFKAPYDVIRTFRIFARISSNAS